MTAAYLPSDPKDTERKTSCIWMTVENLIKEKAWRKVSRFELWSIQIIPALPVPHASSRAGIKSPLCLPLYIKKHAKRKGTYCGFLLTSNLNIVIASPRLNGLRGGCGAVIPAVGAKSCERGNLGMAGINVCVPLDKTHWSLYLFATRNILVVLGCGLNLLRWE